MYYTTLSLAVFRKRGADSGILEQKGREVMSGAVDVPERRGIKGAAMFHSVLLDDTVPRLF